MQRFFHFSWWMRIGLVIALGSVVVGLRGSIVLAALTAPPDRPVASVTRYAVVGDFGDNSLNEQNVSNLIDSWNPQFVLTVGDNSYGSAAPVPPAASTIDLNIGKYYSNYIGAYNGGYGAGSPLNRFFPTIGNHDYTDGGGITAYLNYFTLPGAVISSTHTSGNERYYDFVQGPIHFFALNSDGNEPDGNTDASTQGQWLQAQLAAAPEPWKVVYFHHAPYSSSSFHGSSTWMQWPFQQWGAAAVLSGHDHTYERVVLNDFPYFVNGAGGHGLYAFGPPIPGSVVRYSANYGAMLVEATPLTMTFKFYSVAGGGTLIDSHTITATAGAPFTVTLQASPTTLIANGSSTAIVTATVVDQLGNFVVDGTTVNFSAARGTVTTPHTTSGGRAVATFTAGTLAGTATLTATANSRSGTIGLVLTPGTVNLSQSVKLASASVVSATGRLTYTIALTNSGNTIATGIALTDAIPPNTTYVNGSVSGGASYNAGQERIEWSGFLPAGGSIALSYAVEVNLPGGGVVTNHAYVSIEDVPDRVLSVSIQVTPSGSPPRMIYFPLITRQP